MGRQGGVLRLPSRSTKIQLQPRELSRFRRCEDGLWVHILDKERGKVVTKYTCGVALLQLPFFCLAELFAKPLGFEQNGFSPVHHWSVNVSSVTYLVLGLVLLMKFLMVRLEASSALIAILSIFLATHLFYYSIVETGMSHVYSFSLFCGFLYFLRRTRYLEKSSVLNGLIAGLLAGLIVLIRPTNLLFLSCFFFLDSTCWSDIISRAKRLTHYKILFPALIGAFVIFLPQLLYWNYSSGSMFYYSYENEGFNWAEPKLLFAWFSPHNGLLAYTPLYLLIIGALFAMVSRKKVNGIYLSVLFFALSYVFSSWHDWGFGCSFGARSYVEYASVFSLPVAHVIHKARGWHLLKKGVLAVLIGACAVFNVRMTAVYDGCFYGKGIWDWEAYLQLVPFL